MTTVPSTQFKERLRIRCGLLNIFDAGRLLDEVVYQGVDATSGRRAKQRHGTQTRKTGELYITHPVAVAGILVGQQMDMICLVSALLHDVLEDTATKPEEIRAQFGDEVLRCVEGVTKIGKIHLYSREDRQAESVRKMLLAMVSDIRAPMRQNVRL